MQRAAEPRRTTQILCGYTCSDADGSCPCMHPTQLANCGLCSSRRRPNFIVILYIRGPRPDLLRGRRTGCAISKMLMHPQRPNHLPGHNFSHLPAAGGAPASAVQWSSRPIVTGSVDLSLAPQQQKGPGGGQRRRQTLASRVLNM